MAEGLKIKIGADTTQAVGELEKLNKKVKELKPASSQAYGALQGLNRVLQDLPFGFVAIQNNIEELPNAFRNLSAAAKESGQTIGGTLLKALSGAGGVGIAVSALSAALTFATVGFGAWTRGMNSSGKAAKKAATDMDEFSKAANDALEGVAKDASKVSTLVLALQGGSLTILQRKKALEELKSTNNEFFGALKEEKGIIEGLQGAYDEYLKRIDKIATAKALESQLTKLFDKKLELELSIDPKFIAATDAATQERIGRLKKELQSLGGPVDFSKDKGNLQAGNDQLNRRIKLQDQIAEAEKGAAFFQDKNLLSTKQQINKLELQINGLRELQKDVANFDVTPGTPTPKGPKKLNLKQLFDIENDKGDQLFLRVREEAESQLNKALDDVAKRNAGFFDKLFMQTPAGGGTKNAKLNVLPSDEDVKVRMADIKQQLLNGFAALGIKPPEVSFLTDMTAQVNVLSEALTKAQKTFSGIANFIIPELGKAFTNVFEDIESGGKNAFTLFGDAIVGVVKKLIAAALTALIFTAIIGAVTGGAGFAANATGAKTFLASFKSLFGQLGGIKLAGGGITTGPTSALIGDNPGGREAVIPLDDKILKNLRGEGNGGGYVAETRIGFDELIIGFRRAERRNGFLT